MTKRVAITALVAAALVASGFRASTRPQAIAAARTDLSRQVEIIRTAHGVPHIRADNMLSAGYALAWVMAEDYGPRTATRISTARAQQSRTSGRASLDADFEMLRSRRRAIDTYHLLDQDTRDMYE